VARVDIGPAPAFDAAFTAEDHEHEETPYLVMDLAGVERRFHELEQGLAGVRIHYAMKCNADPEVLARLLRCGCAFEIASRAELETLSSIRVDPESVLFSNPVKRAVDIESAWSSGVRRYAFDSVEELQKIATCAPGGSVYVRLSTSPRASTVPSEGKFGVGPQDAADLLRLARTLGLHPLGITFHVGSQMVDPHAWVSPMQRCAEIMCELAKDGIHLSMIDVGGGFPVSYDAAVPSYTAYGEVIRSAIERLPYEVMVVAEPGRALVADSGILVSTVIGTARRFGQKWVHLDVGAFNGMMESLETQNALRFPVRDSLDSRETESCHLTGPTCDAQDTILYDVQLSKDLGAGDRVYIGNAGGYTTGYASTFNGFGIPPTCCVDHGSREGRSQ
jgi:ornithine decarboxylase